MKKTAESQDIFLEVRHKKNEKTNYMCMRALHFDFYRLE